MKRDERRLERRRGFGGHQVKPRPFTIQKTTSTSQSPPTKPPTPRVSPTKKRLNSRKSTTHGKTPKKSVNEDEMIKAEVLNSSHGPGEEREDNAESKDKRRTRLSYKATGTIPVVKFHFGGDVTSNTITETETHRHHSPPPPLPAKQRSNQSKSEPPATLPVKAPKKSKKRVTEAHAEPDDDAFVFRKKKKSRKGVETSSDEVVATDNAQVSSSPKEEAAKAEDNAKNTDEGKKLEEVKKAEEVTTTVRLTKGKGKAQIDAVQPEHVEEEISKDADLKTKPVLQDKNVQEKITPDREDPEKYATISQADILPHLNVRVGSKDLDIILKTVFKVLSQRKKQKVVFSDLRKEVLHELAAAAE